MSDGMLVLRAGIALVLANLRYWSTVAPTVRRELGRWSSMAKAIPDPYLRELAERKLRTEHFNAEVAATLATLAPKAHRNDAVEAIVAFEVLYDYLDGLTERPVDDPLRSGFRLYQAFTGALGIDAEPSGDYYAFQAQADDGGYLQELSATARAAVQRLPARRAVVEATTNAVARCAEGQVRVHAASQVGSSQLEEWARASARNSGLGWREYAAGAVASVLAAHALIALAATSDVTAEEARATDTAYLSISALSTMLDSLIDYERDVAAGDPWLVRYYGDPRLLGDRLAEVAEQAVAQVEPLRNRAHHLMTLVGVVAYYTSAREARGEPVGPLIGRLRLKLRPLLTPTLAVMRAWRLAKRLRAQREHRASGQSFEQ
jgi:hypothetical protein